MSAVVVVPFLLAGGLVMMTFAPEILQIAKPRRVIIAAGINDAAPNALTEPAAFRMRYAAAIQAARAVGATISVATIAPTAPAGPLGGSYFDQRRIAAFNREILGLGVSVIKLDTLADGSGRLPQNDTEDGVHLIPAAYSIWERAMNTACPKPQA